MESTLNIFTLNCWGIPIVSKDRKERMKGIAQYLLTSAHNIVCLQEIWSEKDFIYFRDTLKSVLPYSHYFYSGVLGSGLCVFSKWIIQDVFFHQWPLNGYIHKVQHGDWFGGKGVGLCRIKFENKFLNVYCTHLHAEYHEDDMYLAHRVLQAFSTAKFVNLTACSADVSILAGDLNTAPGDLSFRLLTSIPALLDPFELEHENTNPDIARACGTSDNENNSYASSKEVKKLPEGKRIDHILFRTDSNIKVKILNFGNPLKDRVPGHSFSYSDHNAVCLEVILSNDENNSKNLCPLACFNVPLSTNINEAIKVCEDAKETLIRSKKLFLVAGGLLLMLLLGTVGLWSQIILHDLVRICVTCVSLYYFVMGTIWNRIEMNSIKAGLSALKKYAENACTNNIAD